MDLVDGLNKSALAPCHLTKPSFVSIDSGNKKFKSTIQRSTETGMAAEMRSRMVRQPSRESTDGSINSYSSEGK